MSTDDKTMEDVQPGGRVRLPQEQTLWRSMDTCPRDGTVVRLRWGEDHVSPGWWSAPVAPVQNSDGTWPSDTGGFPWAFIDFNDGSAFINHAVDTQYGPTRWAPYAALSAQRSLGGQDARRCADHCQNGRADVCLASQRDGVICPEDSCDIDDGIRHNHLAARQRLNGLSWADYWMGRGQPAVAHDFDAFSRAEAWALQRFHDARQPVGEPITVEAVAEILNHPEYGLSINWLLENGIGELQVGDVLMVSDRAITDEDGSGEVYTAPPAQAVDLGTLITELAEADREYAEAKKRYHTVSAKSGAAGGRASCRAAYDREITAKRRLDSAVRALIDSQVVGNG